MTMSPKELMQLFDTQQATVTIDQHQSELEQRANLETERVQLQRQLSVCKKNIQHYEESAFDVLLRSPESFGPSVIELLRNICKAKAMTDKPALYEELHQLQTRLAEIKEVTG
jgi:hypothetical protein